MINHLPTQEVDPMGHSISTREAATANRVSVRTIQRWAKAGKLNAAKQSGRWVITIQAPTLADYKPDQIDRAHDAIEQGAILATSRPGMFTAVASDGSTHYLAHRAGCTCPAGQRGRSCYHRAAVAILEAAEHARRAA